MPVFHIITSVIKSYDNNDPQVHATDEDKGVNGQVKYSIVQQPNQKGTKFTVDEETGEVSTNKVRLLYLHVSYYVFPHFGIVKLQYRYCYNIVFYRRLMLQF